MAQRAFQLPFCALCRHGDFATVYLIFLGIASGCVLLRELPRRFHIAFACTPCRMVHRLHRRGKHRGMPRRRTPPANMGHLRRSRRHRILLGIMRVLMGGDRGEFFARQHVPKPCVRPRARLGRGHLLYARRRHAVGHCCALLRRGVVGRLSRKPHRFDHSKRPDPRTSEKHTHLHAHRSRSNALRRRAPPMLQPK